MLSERENEILTRVGAETAGGRVLRGAWQPVALSAELAEKRPVKAVRVLGEDLVLFRDPQGRLGLIDRHCAHRGADLSYGRLEEGGLRCTFHGWLFDVEGRCLMQPAERKPFQDKVRHKAYPCREKNGVIFAYMGEGEAPPLPGMDCLEAPAEYTFAFKGYVECNWAQGLEGGIDPSHTSFLHVFFKDEEAPTYGRQFGDITDGDEVTLALPLTGIMREHRQPTLDVVRTDYGLRLETRRDLGDGLVHVRITNWVYPNCIVVPMSRNMVLAQWHVPVDDYSHYWYMIAYSFAEPVDQRAMWEQRIKMYPPPEFRPVRNRGNNYGWSLEDQLTFSYTGLGEDINIHDTWAWEGQGAVQDRTREHLGPMDRAIILFRRMFLEATSGKAEVGRAVKSGEKIGPPAIDLITREENWKESWRRAERRRKEKCAWLARTA